MEDKGWNVWTKDQLARIKPDRNCVFVSVDMTAQTVAAMVGDLETDHNIMLAFDRVEPHEVNLDRVLEETLRRVCELAAHQGLAVEAVVPVIVSDTVMAGASAFGVFDRVIGEYPNMRVEQLEKYTEDLQHGMVRMARTLLDAAVDRLEGRFRAGRMWLLEDVDRDLADMVLVEARGYRSDAPVPDVLVAPALANYWIRI